MCVAYLEQYCDWGSCDHGCHFVWLPSVCCHHFKCLWKILNRGSCDHCRHFVLLPRVAKALGGILVVMHSTFINYISSGGYFCGLLVMQVCARYTRITGSLGELTWQGSESGPILVHNFRSETVHHGSDNGRGYLTVRICSKNGHYLICDLLVSSHFYVLECSIMHLTVSARFLISSGRGGE